VIDGSERRLPIELYPYEKEVLHLVDAIGDYLRTTLRLPRGEGDQKMQIASGLKRDFLGLQ